MSKAQETQNAETTEQVHETSAVRHSKVREPEFQA